MRSTITTLGLIVGMSLGSSRSFIADVNAEDRNGAAAEAASKLVTMPITYDRTMLVIVTRAGAAAVRFYDPFEKGNEIGSGMVGVSYEWRFLERKPDALEQSGKGRLFVKLSEGEFVHGWTSVKCGLIEFDWRAVNTKNSTVSYDPEHVAIHPVSPQFFAGRERPDGQLIDRVDLSHFLYSDEASTKAHLTEVYTGPETQHVWHKGEVAGPIQYRNCKTVIRTPQGTATFIFSQEFERQPEPNLIQQGTTYDFTFVSHDGKVRQSGTGEVYERQKNNRYDHGHLWLEAGPIHVNWSRGGQDSGWLYYDPHWVRVWNTDLASGKQLTDAVIATKLGPDPLGQ